MTGCQGIAHEAAKEAAPAGIDQSLKTLAQPDSRATVASILDDPPIGRVFNEFGEHIGHGIIERASAEFATALSGKPLATTARGPLPPASQRAATPGLELGEGDDGPEGSGALAPSLAFANGARDTLRAASRLALFAVVGLALVLLILIAGIVLALARASQAKHRAEEHDRRLTALIAAVSNTAAPESKELLQALAAPPPERRRPPRHADASSDKNAREEGSPRDNVHNPDHIPTNSPSNGPARDRETMNR